MNIKIVQMKKRIVQMNLKIVQMKKNCSNEHKNSSNKHKNSSNEHKNSSNEHSRIQSTNTLAHWPPVEIESCDICVRCYSFSDQYKIKDFSEGGQDFFVFI